MPTNATTNAINSDDTGFVGFVKFADDSYPSLGVGISMVPNLHLCLCGQNLPLFIILREFVGFAGPYLPTSIPRKEIFAQSKSQGL